MIVKLILALGGLFLGLGLAAAAPTCSEISDMSQSLLNVMLAPHPTPSSNLHPLALRLGNILPYNLLC